MTVRSVSYQKATHANHAKVSHKLRLVKQFVCAAGIVAAVLITDASAFRQTAAPASLEAAAAAAAKLPRLRSLLVSHKRQVVLERYFNGARAAQPANIKSASKSVISALVGIAVSRGLIKDVDQKIGAYFPELATDPEPRKRDITIEDLLTMRSGLESTSGRNYGAWVQSPNWVRFVLRRPMIDEPGTRVEYSTGSSHLLSAILTKAAKMSTWQFAQEELAKPLGLLAGAVDAGSAGHLLRRQRDADDAAADGALRRAVSERRQGRRSADPAEVVDRSHAGRPRADRAGAAIANTATDSGFASSPGTTAITRGATAGSSSSSFPTLDLVIVTTSRSDVSPSGASISTASTAWSTTSYNSPGTAIHPRINSGRSPLQQVTYGETSLEFNGLGAIDSHPADFCRPLSIERLRETFNWRAPQRRILPALELNYHGGVGAHSAIG